MAQVKYIDANDTVTEVTVEAGENVMNAALDNMVDGIVGECGGALACATCHCYIDEKDGAQFGEISEMEEAMLEMVPERRATSRLSCQLEISDNTTDIEVTLPESQY